MKNQEISKKNIFEILMTDILLLSLIYSRLKIFLLVQALMIIMRPIRLKIFYFDPAGFPESLYSNVSSVKTY